MLVLLSLALLSVYFRESEGGTLHDLQGAGAAVLRPFEEAADRVAQPFEDAADWFDRWVLAGLVIRGAHGTVELFGRALRLVQCGNLQTYAFLFAAGLAVVAWAILH